MKRTGYPETDQFTRSIRNAAAGSAHATSQNPSPADEMLTGLPGMKSTRSAPEPRTVRAAPRRASGEFTGRGA